jgi:hypothetical protein
MALEKNLFDQLSPTAVDAMASCLGFNEVSAGFRGYLRDIPALPNGDDFTLGEALDAYLLYMIQRQLKLARMPDPV